VSAPYCSEGCEEGATSENSGLAKFAFWGFSEVQLPL
jgi:hypothetical protein